MVLFFFPPSPTIHSELEYSRLNLSFSIPLLSTSLKSQQNCSNVSFFFFTELRLLVTSSSFRGSPPLSPGFPTVSNKTSLSSSLMFYTYISRPFNT